mmetsp:Transcript_45670/g.146571  ORF Transcript_45670/g.146571 Transcript_45670/m.146571 type:complete len:452 (-) Transcript_45670:113-1468(-)
MVFDAVVVGIGVNGLRILSCLSLYNLTVIGFEKGRVGDTIRRWPLGIPVAGTMNELSVDVELTTDRFCLNPDTCSKQAYLKYLNSVVAKRGLDVRELEEVTDVRALPLVAADASAGGAAAGGEGGFWVATRKADGSEGGVRARFVVLAVGAWGDPTPLKVPGSRLPFVAYPEELTSASRDRWTGKNVLVSGSGTTALLLARSLCTRGARKVVVCTKAPTIRRALGYMSAKERDQAYVTKWARERYDVTDMVLQDDLDFMEEFRNQEVFQALQNWQRQGTLELRPVCKLQAIHEDGRVELKRFDRGSRAARGTTWCVRGQGLRGSIIEVVDADLVVASSGHDLESLLPTRLPFPKGQVDAQTGETTIAGVFAIGFDPPGSGKHHYGILQEGKIIYDNWMCWGGFAARNTCSEIARRIRRIRQNSRVPAANRSYHHHSCVCVCVCVELTLSWI